MFANFVYFPSPVFIDGMHDRLFEDNIVTVDFLNLMIFVYLNPFCLDIGSTALLYLNIFPFVWI